MKLAPWNDPTVRWVCENHPDKEWEIECGCGAGMPEPTPENYQKGYITNDNMEHLIKDTKKRTAQRNKSELLADLAILVAITFIGAGLAFAVADAVFGQEAVTNWLAALVI